MFVFFCPHTVNQFAKATETGRASGGNSRLTVSGIQILVSRARNNGYQIHCNSCCDVRCQPSDLRVIADADVLFWGRVRVHKVDYGTGIVHRLDISLDSLQLRLLLTLKHKFQNITFYNNPGTGLSFDLYGDGLV